MKKSSFVMILFVIATAVSYAIFEFILGNPSNFADYAT